MHPVNVNTSQNVNLTVSLDEKEDHLCGSEWDSSSEDHEHSMEIHFRILPVLLRIKQYAGMHCRANHCQCWRC